MKSMITVMGYAETVLNISISSKTAGYSFTKVNEFL
jgi:hypothetical protein